MPDMTPPLHCPQYAWDAPNLETLQVWRCLGGSRGKWCGNIILAETSAPLIHIPGLQNFGVKDMSVAPLHRYVHFDSRHLHLDFTLGALLMEAHGLQLE